MRNLILWWASLNQLPPGQGQDWWTARNLDCTKAEALIDLCDMLPLCGTSYCGGLPRAMWALVSLLQSLWYSLHVVFNPAVGSFELGKKKGKGAKAKTASKPKPSAFQLSLLHLPSQSPLFCMMVVVNIEPSDLVDGPW